MKFRILEIKEGGKAFFKAQTRFLGVFWITMEYRGQLPGETSIYLGHRSTFTSKEDAEFVIKDRLNFERRKTIIHEYDTEEN